MSMMFYKLILALLALLASVMATTTTLSLLASSPMVGLTTRRCPLEPSISPEGIPYLLLRDDFPQDNRALNLTLLIELMSENKTLPQLPGIEGMSFAPKIPPKGNRWWQTTDVSPHFDDVWTMHFNLAALVKKPGRRSTLPCNSESRQVLYHHGLGDGQQ
jgi:hypothetical protein